MTETLKPCPFCGGEAHLDPELDYRADTIREDTGIVGCPACDCYPGPIQANADAIAAWNRRASDWQPIETAPRDGTVIDLWSPEFGRICDVWWDDEDGGWIMPPPANYTHWRVDTPPEGQP